MLTYSNVEAASICFSETFEALAEGIEKALWQIGGVPQQHRTDHLSAAVRNCSQPEKEDWTVRYQALMAHYGMQPTWNNLRIAHENGDVEQSHHRFKEAVDQALRVRASRDFATRELPMNTLSQNLIHKRNQTRAEKFAAENKRRLRPLPSRELAPCKELRVRGVAVLDDYRRHQPSTRSFALDWTLPFWYECAQSTWRAMLEPHGSLTDPRLIGKHQHRIDYHHVIHASRPQAWCLCRLSLSRRTCSRRRPSVRRTIGSCLAASRTRESRVCAHFTPGRYHV